MAAQAPSLITHDFGELFRTERLAFAAKIRMARAVLGWSQGELGFRVDMTQRAIHKLEQGETEPRRSTMRAIELVWREEGIEFEDLADGGFQARIRAPLLTRPKAPTGRRRRPRTDLGVTSVIRAAGTVRV